MNEALVASPLSSSTLATALRPVLALFCEKTLPLLKELCFLLSSRNLPLSPFLRYLHSSLQTPEKFKIGCVALHFMAEMARDEEEQKRFGRSILEGLLKLALQEKDSGL